MSRSRITMTGIDELWRAVDGFGKDAPKVAARALNKTATSSRAESVRLLRQLLMLKAGDIRKGTSVQRANWKNLRAAVIATGRKGVPLIKYPVRPSRPNPKRKPARGVSVQVKRFGGPKTIDGAFVTRMKTGHVGVFRRRSGKRLPVKQLYGPNFVNYLRGGRIRRKLGRSISNRLETNLRHEIGWEIQKTFKGMRGAR